MNTTLAPTLALVLSGCLAFEQDPTLDRFEDCDAVRSYMVDMAMKEVRYEDQFDWSLGSPFMVSYEMSMDDSGAVDVQEDDRGADSYSTTNLQEASVDEADLIKTDGEYVYAVTADHLVVARAWPIDQAEALSSTPIDGSVFGIYLYDDVVVAVSAVVQPSPRAGGTVDEADLDSGAVGVTVIDVADPADPQVVRESYVSGVLRDTRRIGDLLYVVAYVDISVWRGAEDLGEAKERIRQADIARWMPWQQDNRRTGMGWQTEQERACGCSDVWASSRQTGSLVTTVLSLDLSDPLSAFDGQAVVGRADVVYASPEAMYVAYSEEEEGPFRSFDVALDTVVHAFDLTGEAPVYLDTAQLWGVLVDQFSLSEHRGVLRVATTDHRDWTTHVFTMDKSEGELERLDHLGGLAPGEELYAVRFVGDLGYLVTYEVAQPGETIWDIEFGDPLFTLDLSDPTHIRAVGELVMNGWSDYLHPMGEGHLLAVGMDQDQADRWKLAISLFDVSDLANPILEDRELLDARTSEAQDDHHAFNYFPPQEVLVLPSDTLDGAWVLQVVQVDFDGVESVGQVEQAAWPSACTRMRRSVVMEDKVWAFSEGGLTAAALDEPGAVLNSVPFTVADCW